MDENARLSSENARLSSELEAARRELEEMREVQEPLEASLAVHRAAHRRQSEHAHTLEPKVRGPPPRRPFQNTVQPTHAPHMCAGPRPRR